MDHLQAPNAPLTAAEQTERDTLIKAELRVSGQRATALADVLRHEIGHFFIR